MKTTILCLDKKMQIVLLGYFKENWKKMDAGKNYHWAEGSRK